MTREEFAQWRNMLFTHFPTFASQLEKAENPAATLATWYPAIEPYTLAEANWVVESWSNGTLPVPAGYDYDRLHLLTRSHIGLRRDRFAKSQEQTQIKEKYRSLPNTPYTDAKMAEAYGKLKPHWVLFDSGQITSTEYARRKKPILDTIC